MHVYRWDLDKTYLQTEFESVRAMVRTAFEPASRKRNVPGSAALLRALVDHDPSCRVAIVSGSPTQLRAVLEEKLALDGVRFDSLVLKDNLGNLRRGRLRAVTGQLGYKLPILFEERASYGSVTETLFGDDAEVDVLIYVLYADAIAGRITPADVARVMEVGRAYPDDIEVALRALELVERRDVVEDVFIRLERGVPVDRFQALGERVIPIHSWLQAALVLWCRGRLDGEGVARVARATTREADLDDSAVVGLIQDLARRGHIDPDAVQGLFERTPSLASLRRPVARALARLGVSVRPGVHSSPPDYLGFLRAVQ